MVDEPHSVTFFTCAYNSFKGRARGMFELEWLNIIYEAAQWALKEILPSHTYTVMLHTYKAAYVAYLAGKQMYK